ncbi:hypothetical protein [Paracidovorax sp. MALMAid1276]|uniref:hypothetical protein n=1 Tax=Paracidovorax sp. MALMAid1276 TaxID=3411631 RepID=UPI003B9C7F5C
MTGLLDPERIALVAKGVSAIVASRDAALRPSVMRAVASRISADGREVTVYLRRSQSAQLLSDIAQTGEIAVVFSVPSTHQTLQVKARQATQRPARDDDLPVLEAYLHSMVDEVGRVGYGPKYVIAMLDAPLADVVAVSFMPTSAYDQTPGPRAGAPLPSPPPSPTSSSP